MAKTGQTGRSPRGRRRAPSALVPAARACLRRRPDQLPEAAGRRGATATLRALLCDLWQRMRRLAGLHDKEHRQGPPRQGHPRLDTTMDSHDSGHSAPGRAVDCPCWRYRLRLLTRGWLCRGADRSGEPHRAALAEGDVAGPNAPLITFEYFGVSPQRRIVRRCCTPRLAWGGQEREQFGESRWAQDPRGVNCGCPCFIVSPARPCLGCPFRLCGLTCLFSSLSASSRPSVRGPRAEGRSQTARTTGLDVKAA